MRASSEPVLLMASVGAGKSIMLAYILLKIQKAGKSALCLVNNAELVRNNCETFRYLGGDASIYCAALDEKDTENPVIFASPQSVLNGINKRDKIGQIRFNLIIVDEAHAINYLNERSCFMRILRHFRQQYAEMRVLGATGTNFRFKGYPIVGDDCLFKTQVGNITTEKLIEEGYLIKPSFSVDENLVLDFSKVKIRNGRFDTKGLEETIEKSARLTELICNQIVHIMNNQQRFGVFIFATTRKHAEEIMTYLPMEESALILGETKQEERIRILDEARAGKIRFLVNIAIVAVGVDVPAFDTIAYARPTESLVLLVQTMGRALRLSPATNKKEALILDFAGNIERHSHWDNPIILDAVKQIDKDKPLVIECPSCNTMNSEHARRCIGMQETRCAYYFEFKECVKCSSKNDIAARNCHQCGHEIIDPNAKLNLNFAENMQKGTVLKARYAVLNSRESFRVQCLYKCLYDNGKMDIVHEHYTLSSQKARNLFYGQFLKAHCEDAGRWYKSLDRKEKVEEILKYAAIPSHLLIARGVEGTKIKKKFFD